MKMTFQPKKRQRSKVHGFRARMKTRGGRKVIAARRAKGRKRLSAQAAFMWPFFPDETVFDLIKTFRREIKVVIYEIFRIIEEE